MAYVQQQPYGAPQGQLANSEWSSGLFDCCAAGCGFCLYASICTPCAYADVKSEFHGQGWCGACLGWMCLLPCHLCCFHPTFRREVAMKHGKNPDSPCNACLVTFCCDCCAIIQEKHQISSNPGAGMQPR